MVYYERNLPHWIPEGKHVFITWRLHGSLPQSVLARLRQQKEPEKGKRFLHFDRELDSSTVGPQWLREREIAQIVQSEIVAIQDRRWCVMKSYVLMPNHVHVLFEPMVELRAIMKAIKGRSARACNSLLRRQGLPFWQQESFDHWVRTAESFGKIQRYIEWNPVSAGLAEKPEAWEWSSAHK
jgi:putative transposase